MRAKYVMTCLLGAGGFSTASEPDKTMNLTTVVQIPLRGSDGRGYIGRLFSPGAHAGARRVDAADE